ncbi:MAG: 3-isopropylmalate dehydratase small subunit [Bacteroidota bacterium]
MAVKGRVWRFGDNVDTDAIIPARYLHTSDPSELARHCMEDADQRFASGVQHGDIIVGGRNFGCGSSREHAPIAIKAAGVSCVIAASFARIFFRNALNVGLPILESPEAARRLEDGDMVEVFLGEGVIRNTGRGEEYRAIPLPEFMQRIVDCGGIINYIREKIGMTP